MINIIGTIKICQGPPRCLLDGDEAVLAAESNCVWCRVIDIYEDGSETRSGPPLLLEDERLN